MLSRASEYEVAKAARLTPLADAGELRQVACETAIRAAAKWRPDGGASKATYEHAAVRRAVYLHVRTVRAPVTASAGYVANLDRTVRVGTDVLGAEVPAREAELDWRAAKREVLRLMAETSPAARLVLLGEEKPAVVARVLQVPVQQVYRETRLAREKIAQSQRLRELLQQEP